MTFKEKFQRFKEEVGKAEAGVSFGGIACEVCGRFEFASEGLWIGDNKEKHFLCRKCGQKWFEFVDEKEGINE